jgi:putative hydrolase of the HAD superfamily
MINVLVFDLDDTLFSEAEFVKSGLQTAGNWILTKYANANFFDVSWQLFNQGNRNNIFDLTLEQLDLDFNLNTIQELVQIYRKHKPVISLYEDAIWATNYFKNYKKMGLITDGYLETQKNKVKALGIESVFDAIVYSDFYGRESWKPSPLPYQKIMESIQCEGQECVYIGDNPSKDFVTAKKLGWMTIHIDRLHGEYSRIATNSDYEADIKISSLTDLKEVFLGIE